MKKLFEMKGQVNIFAALFLMIVLAGVSVVIILNYNGLVKADKSVQEGKAQIEVACQRRLDLIPNLLKTVKASMTHERTTLEAITKARTKALEVLNQTKNKKVLTKEDLGALDISQTQLSRAAGGLFLVVENYPNLKASMNLLALQDQFEGTENRISVSRQRYNMAVRTYNSKIETFPGVFMAPLFGYRPRDFFEAKPEALEPVKADF
jgi:LemA protein